MAQPPPRRTGHPYYMYDSIIAQPESIERIINNEKEHVQTLAVALSNASSIHIVGIGTSWHGALVGEAFFRSVANRHDARAWNSFEFCSLPPTLSATSVVIVLSHRGTKQFSRKSLEIAKEAGAFTALITGLQPDTPSSSTPPVSSPPATPDLTGVVIHTSVQEKSSAFTISHTGAMTALLLTAIELGKLQKVALAEKLQSQVTSLPDLVRSVLALESQIEALAQKLKDIPMIYLSAYGNNVATAYETALKIKEACYVFAEGFQIEQYVHGPFCATDERTVVVFLDHSSNQSIPGPARTKEIIRAALEVGASVVSISGATNDVKSDKYLELLMPPVEESFAPIAYLIATQLFTYKLTLARGENPDVFRKHIPAFADAMARIKL